MSVDTKKILDSCIYANNWNTLTDDTAFNTIALTSVGMKITKALSGNCALFEESNSHMYNYDCKDNFNNNQIISCSFFFNMTSYTSPYSAQHIFFVGTGTNRAVFLFAIVSNMKFRLGARSIFADTILYLDSAITIEFGKNYHIYLEVDYTSKTMYMKINNTYEYLRTSCAFAQNLLTIVNPGWLMIGRYSSSYVYINGLLDELTFFNQKLNSDELTYMIQQYNLIKFRYDIECFFSNFLAKNEYYYYYYYILYLTGCRTIELIESERFIFNEDKTELTIITAKGNNNRTITDEFTLFLVDYAFTLFPDKFTHVNNATLSNLIKNYYPSYAITHETKNLTGSLFRHQKAKELIAIDEFTTVQVKDYFGEVEQKSMDNYIYSDLRYLNIITD